MDEEGIVVRRKGVRGVRGGKPVEVADEAVKGEIWWTAKKLLGQVELERGVGGSRKEK